MRDQDLETDKYGAAPDEELLSLALDCTEMVTELSQGFELERQGDHESAMATLDTVERQIDGWLENLRELDAEGVDKKELVQGLEEAKEAISFDSWE